MTHHLYHVLILVLWWVIAGLAYYFSMYMGWVPKPKPRITKKPYTKENPWGDEK